MTKERADDSSLRQVKAKILDFNWIFNGDNAEKFIKTLSDTDNDAIFATESIRVLIRFLWDGYFDVITTTLFYPFVVYFIAFCMFVTSYSVEHNNDLDFHFVMEMACLVITGKLYINFLLLEMI